VVDRRRREAIRQLAELRARLEAAERALAETEASLEQAEPLFGAVSERVAAAPRTPSTRHHGDGQAGDHQDRRAHRSARRAVGGLRREIAGIAAMVCLAA